MGKISRALSKAAESADTEQVQIDDREEAKTLQPEPPLKSVRRESSGPGKRRTGSGVWDERFAEANATIGPVAESIRNLRTRILYPVMGETPRTILVTSASPGEGKSFICGQLGISLAQGVDSYCLVVDCDMRRPSQHNLFGLVNDRGLVHHLQQGVAPEDLIVKSGVDKLSILPAGPPPVNPAELSGSGAMITLVNELKTRYEDRFVLLDSPPLQAAAETAVLAQHVDGVVLVIRSGFARREHVRSLVDTIGREKVIGVVFNAMKTNILDTKVFGYYDYNKSYYGTENSGKR